MPMFLRNVHELKKFPELKYVSNFEKGKRKGKGAKCTRINPQKSDERNTQKRKLRKNNT